MEAVDGRRLVSPTLVGRAAEIGKLADAVSAPPAVAMVEGEAGIGKTRLVTELATRVPGRRFLVGGCLRIREPFPLGPLIEVIRAAGPELVSAGLSPVTGALRALLPEFAPLLPESPPALADRAAERHRTFRALAEVLASLGPAVLVVEDLHWADEQTVDFLRYLLRDPPSKLSLVLTYRSDETDPDVPALAARLSPAIGQVRVQLSALAVPEAGELAAAILELDRVSEPFARELWRRTSGLPLALEELLALLRARGDLVRDASGGWVRRALDELAVPTGIRDQVWQRVRRLPDPARTVVEAAAVLQAPVPLPVLSATCPPPARRTRSGIEQALAAGVLVESPAGVGLRHLLAAQAVYEAIPAPRRQDLHARAAAALRSRPGLALGQVAHHLRLAGELTGWVDTAERAADQAVALGHEDEAARLLSEVLRSAPLPAQRRGELAVKLGRAAAEAPTAADHPVSELLSAVLELDLPRPVRGELRLLQGAVLELSGADFPTLRRLAAGAVPDLADRPALRAQAMVLLGFPLAPDVPLAENRQWLGRVRQIADRLPDPAFRNWLLGKVAMLLASVGDPGWRPIARRVEDQTTGAPRHHRNYRAYYSIGFAACLVGDLVTAGRLLVACQDGATAVAGGRYGAQLATGSVLLDFCRGAWDGLADRTADLLDQLPGRAGMRDDMEMVAAGLALARGDLDRAGSWYETALPGFARQGRYDQLPIPASGMLRLAVGRARLDQAVAGARWLRTTVGAVPFQVSLLRTLPAMTEALVAGGELAEAQDLVSDYAAVVRGLDAPLAPAALPYSRGLLAAAAGRWQAAAGYFQVAAQRYARAWCRYEAAQAYEQAASALHATGERPAAAAAVRAALVAYQRLGASWDYSRAAGAARRLDLPVPARHRGGHHGYQDDLSPRERQVAELAATGRTNPEIAGELFISVGTVKKQLAAAMHKLGVPSRVVLAARLAGAERARVGPPGP